jgi:acyl-CoA reductase-like NAD-dependent aldehyde dehydrogenase
MTQTIQSLNPANGELVGEVTVTAIADIEAIVAKGRKAANQWRGVSLEERANLLKQAGEILQQQSPELGKLLSDEMGKPLKSGISEVKFCGRGMSSKVANIAAALEQETTTKGPHETVVFYDPLGVCAAISPWNYPMSMPQSMVVPALMAGNAVVLKPSEETPLIAQAYVDVLNQFLPADLLQIVHGADEQGKALVKADVDLIAFTGSRAAGINILNAASDTLKRVMLELGGKDPLIVLDDADIEQAAAMAVSNSFENAGQMCVSTERIYVAESIAQPFEKRMTELSKEVVTGPMINERQRSHVIKQIDDALSNGAQLLCGGTDHPAYYVKPTVLTNVSDDMDIMQAETFGPVACISYFTDIDDAIQRANNSVYALGAAVFGADEARAYGVARQLTAGMIGVNKHCFAGGDSPWVGAKQSGYGFHGSAAGHRQFAQVRVISRQVS